MKKKVWFGVVLLLLLAVTAMGARYETLTVYDLDLFNSLDIYSTSSTGAETKTLGIDSSGNVHYYGTMTKYDASGNIEDYKAADSVQVINYDDLSTLTSQAATSGQSVFWCSPGVHYIVDMMDIAYRAFPAGTAVAFTGVTAIAPEASSANDGKTFSIEWGHVSGNTITFTRAHSGSTTINVAPICLMSGTASTTSYGTPGQVVQSILEPISCDVATGTTGGFVNKAAEMAVYRLQYNAGVSVMPVFYVNN